MNDTEPANDPVIEPTTFNVDVAEQIWKRFTGYTKEIFYLLRDGPLTSKQIIAYGTFNKLSGLLIQSSQLARFNNLPRPITKIKGVYHLDEQWLDFVKQSHNDPIEVENVMNERKLFVARQPKLASEIISLRMNS